MTSIQLALPALGVAMAATGAGAAAQAITGFGFSLLAVPVFVLLVGPAHAVRLANMLSAGVNVTLLAREHRSVELRPALRLLAPAIVVTPVAAYLAHRADPPLLALIVGCVIVACAAVLMSGRRSSGLRGRRGQLAAGAISAAMNTTSGVGGPAVAMYAVNADWPAEMTRPTLQVFFLGLNLVSIVALGPVSVGGAAPALAAAVLVGFGAGTVLLRRLDVLLVGRLVLVLAVLGGAAAIIRGIATA